MVDEQDMSAAMGVTLARGADAISTPETQNAMYDVVAPGGSLVIDTHNRIDKQKLESGEKFVAQVFGDVQRPPEQTCGLALYANITGLLEKGEIKVACFRHIPANLCSHRLCDSLTELKSLLAGWQEYPVLWISSRVVSVH